MRIDRIDEIPEGRKFLRRLENVSYSSEVSQLPLWEEEGSGEQSMY